MDSSEAAAHVTFEQVKKYAGLEERPSLAIFLLLKRISPKLAYEHCSPNIKSYLSKAIIELENSNVIENLRKTGCNSEHN